METNSSGADMISGTNINSGSKVIEHPYIFGCSGEMNVIVETDYGTKVHIPTSKIVIIGSEAEFRWIEKKF